MGLGLGITNLPASSSASAAANVATSAEISIAHTNGSTSTFFNSGGAGESNYTSQGAGCCGGALPGGILLTGTYQTVGPLPGIMTGLDIHTNIVAADQPGGSGVRVQMSLRQACLTDSSSSTTGDRIGAYYDTGSEFQALASGPTFSGNIGDIGTLKTFAPLPPNVVFSQNNPLLVIGGDYTTGAMGTMASYGYWTYAMIIHADYPTKTYKFRFDLHYDS